MPRLIDQLVLPGRSGTGRVPFGLPVEPEILLGRRAFPVTQEIFAGSPSSDPATLEVGWHDTSVSSETGAFGVVQTGANLDALIGQIVRVSFGQRAAFVYVLAALDVPTAFSMSRRAFGSLCRLTAESIACEVVSVQ